MQCFELQEGAHAATGLYIVRLELGGRERAVFCACAGAGLVLNVGRHDGKMKCFELQEGEIAATGL